MNPGKQVLKESEVFCCIGGLTIQIQGPAFQPAKYLESFLTSRQDAELKFVVKPAPAISAPDLPEYHRDSFDADYRNVHVIYNERTGSILLKDTEVLPGVHEVLYEQTSLPSYGAHAILRMINLPKQVLRFGGVFLHASYIVHKGKAILFTAPKQTGKSTQADLWAQYRGAEVINGDRALIRPVGEIWHAFGSPYCGTSRICKNVTAPLQAIVLLSQAPKNEARAASAREALAALLDGSSYEPWDPNQVAQVMDLFQHLISAVPFYKLACTPDVQAVEALEAVL